MNTLKYSLNNAVGTLYLSRPEKRNAFNLDMLKELDAFFRKEAKNPELRLLVIRGEGSKAFSSGVDLSEIVDFNTVEVARRFALQLEETMKQALLFPKPIISVIEGFALGGGYGLASSTDYRLITEDARIGFPAVKIGAILPIGCTLRLNALIGAGKARHLLLTGKIIEATEALTLGLVDEVVQKEKLESRIQEVASQILQGSDLALEMTKKMVNSSLIRDIETFGLSSAENFAYLSQTKEWKERIAAVILKK